MTKESDTKESDGVLLTDGRSRIFLHPPKPYRGGHGFDQQVNLVGGPFQGAACGRRRPYLFLYRFSLPSLGPSSLGRFNGSAQTAADLLHAKVGRVGPSAGTFSAAHQAGTIARLSW
jgi:hypothetical protein